MRLPLFAARSSPLGAITIDDIRSALAGVNPERLHAPEGVEFTETVLGVNDYVDLINGLQVTYTAGIEPVAKAASE